MSDSTSNRKNLIPILIIAFLDFLGVSIVIPVLAPLVLDNPTGLIPDGFGPDDRKLIYGILIAVYPLAQFFGAPILGALADRHGRKKMLLISLIGSLVGYVLFAYAIYSNHLVLAFASRIIDGFTGGNISIVFSAVADISNRENKTNNFGLVGMMAGVGFVIGPFVGGVLANDELVSWFGPQVPFWTAAGLFLVTIIMLQVLFTETLKEKNNRPIRPLTGVRNLIRAFTIAELRDLFIVIFLFTLGFAFFTQFFQVFLVDQYGFDEMDIGLLFGYVGICIAITQGGLVRLVTKWFVLEKIPLVALLILALALGAVILPREVWLLYAIVPFVAGARGITKPVMDTLVSNQASEDQQGEILGINQSIAAIGLAVPPLVSGFIAQINSALPTIVGAVLVLVGWIYYLLVHVRSERDSNG